jgi:hypothetical protein
MGKRSSFVRNKHDAYDTPAKALLPLLPLLKPAKRFIEPCAGAGALVRALEEHGHHCAGAFDVEPRGEGISKGDAATFDVSKHYNRADCFITNPPWSRPVLHPIIFNLFWQLPTWLLLDADWMHTQQAAPYLALCTKIVSIGRVRWIEGSASDGKENSAWYLFEPRGRPEFFGRGS